MRESSPQGYGAPRGFALVLDWEDQVAEHGGKPAGKWDFTARGIQALVSGSIEPRTGIREVARRG